MATCEVEDRRHQIRKHSWMFVESKIRDVIDFIEQHRVIFSEPKTGDVSGFVAIVAVFTRLVEQ